jgi:hypothetical protein
VTRWTLASLALLVVAGSLAVAAARFFGRPGSRASVLVSVAAHWLGAYVLWTFAGGLLLRSGALATYDGSYYALLALGAGVWHYRAHVRAGRERGLAVFVGGQLAWLVFVLVQNGLLGH